MSSIHIRFAANAQIAWKIVTVVSDPNRDITERAALCTAVEVKVSTGQLPYLAYLLAREQSCVVAKGLAAASNDSRSTPPDAVVLPL
jgi:hypothetical protein